MIGKTFIIDDFAKRNYENYIYINFELMPEYKKIFDGNLDIKTLIMKLEVTFPDKKIVPNKTILFLDEIQSCPNARTALKTFSLDGTIDVISSGSLLGLYYKEVRSYPVGYERIIDLYPLDFEEFLWGVGIKKEIIELVKNCFKIYMRDTGLLISMFESGVQKAIMNDELYINRGAILENVCCEELKTRYDKVMYFEKKSSLEIDFILNLDGQATAVEVKSGNNKQAKSLKSILENYKTVTRYIKLEKDCNIYVDDNNIEHYPLFMIMFL